jgi:hypothetical protein
LATAVSAYLGIELFVLTQEVDTEVGESDEVLQLAGRGYNHLPHHVLCTHGGRERSRYRVTVAFFEGEPCCVKGRGAVKGGAFKKLG